MAFGDENQLEGGAGIVSAGLAIFFLNWLFRTGRHAASTNATPRRPHATTSIVTAAGRTDPRVGRLA